MNAQLTKCHVEDYHNLVKAHRSSFIQSSDFAVSIAARGFNAVRIVPWYVSFLTNRPQVQSYVSCITVSLIVLEWAEELGLHVIFCAAANPGPPDGLNQPGGAPRTRISGRSPFLFCISCPLHYAHRQWFLWH